MTARRATLAGLVAISLVTLWLGACGDGRKFTVIVEVQSDDGKPMPAVPVKLGDGTRGLTNEMGQLVRRVVGEEGARFPVVVEPPRGYALVGKARNAVVLRHLEDESGRSRPIEFQVKLAPTRRKYAVLVRAGTPGLPVETFGERRAVTNREGVAMFLYEGTPGEQLTVKLDTSSNPRLVPQNPVATFQLGNKSQAFVVKEHFTLTPEKKRPKIRRIGPHRL